MGKEATQGNAERQGEAAVLERPPKQQRQQRIGGDAPKAAKEKGCNAFERRLHRPGG